MNTRCLTGACIEFPPKNSPLGPLRIRPFPSHSCAIFDGKYSGDEHNGNDGDGDVDNQVENGGN